MSRRSPVTVLLLGAAALAAALTLASPAHAAPVEVRLTGTNAADAFSVVPSPTDSTRLELCGPTGCVTRLRTDVLDVVVNGLDGDDVLVVGHGTGFLSNGAADLPVSFNAGAGADEVWLCDGVQVACTGALTTAVVTDPGSDQVQVLQCPVPAGPDGCAAFGEPGSPLLRVTATGVARVLDRTPGRTVLAGTAGDDVVTLRASRTVTDLGPDTDAGLVTVGDTTAYAFHGKGSLLLDALTGADRFDLAGGAGLGGPGQRCAGGAALCVRADGTADDVVGIPHTGGADLVGLAGTVGTTVVTGTQLSSTVRLEGVDEVRLPQRPADGDALTLVGTDADDHLLATATADGLRLSGLQLPVVALTRQGPGALALTLDGAAGTDGAVLAGTPGADDYRATGTDEGCPVPADCLSWTSGTDPLLALRALAVERHSLTGGDGDDRLDADAGLRPALHFAGDAGSDTLTYRGDGAAPLVDLGAGTVRGDAGVLTLTGTERQDVDAAGRVLSVRTSDDADGVTVSPSGGDSATVRVGGDPRTVHATRAGLLVVDAGAGDDVVQVEATSAADAVSVTRSLSTTVQATGLLPVRVPAAAETLRLSGGGGEDRFLLSGAGGPAGIVLDGGTAGAAGDTVSAATLGPDAALALGAVPGTGTLTAAGPALQLVELEHVELEGSGGGSLTLTGTEGDDTLTQLGNRVAPGRGADVVWGGYATLALQAAAGDDTVLVSPGSLTGDVQQLTVDGGPGAADALLVEGSAGRDAVTYGPTGPGAGTLRSAGAAVVSLTGTEAVRYDGRSVAPTGDSLVHDPGALAGRLVATPGATSDAGGLRLVADAGASTAPPLTWVGLGAGRVAVAGPPNRDVQVDGSPGDDVVVVGRAPGGDPQVVVGTRLPLEVPGARRLFLHPAGGDDVVRVPGDHGVPGDGAGGPGVVVAAGGSAGDLLELLGTGGALTVSTSDGLLSETSQVPVAGSGLARVLVLAAGAPVTVRTGEGPDALVVAPTGPAAAGVSGSGPALELVGTSALLVDPAGGGDHVTVQGTTAAERIELVRGAASTVQVGATVPVTLAGTTEALQLATREGGDVVRVTGSGGPASTAVDGGAPSGDGDRLEAPAPDASLTATGTPGTARLDTTGGAVLLSGVDAVSVTGDGSGTVTAQGTAGPDTITAGDAGTPRVQVGEGPLLEQSGYRTLRLVGAAGPDRVSVAYDALDAVTRVEVVGGTVAEDLVTVTDTPGTARRLLVTPTGTADATLTTPGQPDVVLTGAAGLALAGRGAGDEVAVVSPAGADTVRVTQAAADDEGQVRVGSLVPVSFSGLGDGRLTLGVVDAAAEDRVELTGRPGSETVDVDGTGRRVRAGTTVPVTVDGTRELVLLTDGGTDTVRLTGPLPWATTSVDAGGDGDVVSLDGPDGDVVADLGAGTVTGYGGVVQLTGVGRVATDLAGRGLTTRATARDDALCFDPQLPRDGRLHVVGAPAGGSLGDVCLPDARGLDLLHTFTDVGRFVVDPGAGVDQLIVNGTVADDVMTVTADAPYARVTLNPAPADPDALRLPVEVDTRTTENVTLATDAGRDHVEVTVLEVPGPVWTVHGEDPVKSPGDVLDVRDGTGGAELRKASGNINGSGTITATWRRYSGTQQRVDYSGMEAVNLFTRKR